MVSGCFSQKSSFDSNFGALGDQVTALYTCAVLFVETFYSEPSAGYAEKNHLYFLNDHSNQSTDGMWLFQPKIMI